MDDSLTIDLETPACGAVAVGGNTVVIGCVDDTAHAYALADSDENGKAILAGQKLYTLYLPSSVSAMTVLDVNRARRTERVAFATRNGEIRVYHGTALVLALGRTSSTRAWGCVSGGSTRKRTRPSPSARAATRIMRGAPT